MRGLFRRHGGFPPFLESASSWGPLDLCRELFPQSPQHWPQLRQGPRPVAEGVLDARAEFTERPVIFRDEEEKVVAEPAAAARRADNDALAAPLDNGFDIPLRVGEGGGAHV